MTARNRFARRRLIDLGTLLSGATGLSIVVAVAAKDGGERPTTWYPAVVALCSSEPPPSRSTAEFPG